MKHARKDYAGIQEMGPIITTVHCPNSTNPENPCPGCLTGELDEQGILFKCGECGEEVGRGVFAQGSVGIPQEEPVFMLRAQDEVAAATKMRWPRPPCGIGQNWQPRPGPRGTQ